MVIPTRIITETTVFCVITFHIYTFPATTQFTVPAGIPTLTAVFYVAVQIGTSSIATFLFFGANFAIPVKTVQAFSTCNIASPTVRTIRIQVHTAIHTSSEALLTHTFEPTVEIRTTLCALRTCTVTSTTMFVAFEVLYAAPATKNLAL
ncbi:MAG: hypothetical protein AAGJ35_14430 [Myxococcota bacterium]